MPYLRVGADGQTVANQERGLREVATAEGWEMTEDVQPGEGMSGAKGRDGRPGLDKAWRGPGRYEVLGAWSVCVFRRNVTGVSDG